MVNFNVLTKSPIFKGLSEEELKELFGHILFRVKYFKKDDLIACSGDELLSLCVLQKGSARGEMIDYSGKTLKIEDIETPKTLASAFLFGKKNRFPVTVIANNDVELLSIPKPEYLNLLQTNRTILNNYLNTISSRTQFLSEKLHFLSFKSIKEKIANLLLNMAGSTYHSVELKYTQQQLADLFGVTRPSLARVFGKMQDEGLIKINKRTITLTNKKGLNELFQKN
ncbi:MAG: Crp/Fnr family transcriptional regulator [Chlorobi bacterium]|nr:Crp/Fnr family transcriptional regulator [Chlorobiota bacterium]